MNRLPPIEVALWILNTSAMALLLARLWLLRLSPSYIWLSAYLSLNVAGSLALMALPYNTNAYGYTWLSVEFLKWTFAAFVAREIAGRVLANYQGISALSRRTLLLIVLLCALASLTLTSFAFATGSEPYPHLKAALLFQQGVALALLFCLLCLVLFVLWFPMPLPRNVHLYCFGFALPLFVVAATVGARVFGGLSWTRPMSTLSLGLQAAAFVAWAVFLRRSNETGSPIPAIPRESGAEQRLLAQLASLNQVLESRRRNL